MHASIFLYALAAALCSSALYTPRSRHAAIARHAVARAALPLPAPAPVADLGQASALRKARRQNKTCRQRPTSALPPTPSSSSSPSSQPSQAVQNVAPAPSSQAHTDAPAPSPPAAQTHTSAAPPPPPPPSPTPVSQAHTQAPPKTTAAPPPPAPSPAPASGAISPLGGFFAGDNNGGDGTFYTPGLGACGFTNDASQLVAAVPYGLFDNVPGAGANPNLNPVCGLHALVSYQGKSVRVQLVDRCADCNNADSLDMSPAAFNQLADPSVGRIHDISWHFVA